MLALLMLAWGCGGSQERDAARGAAGGAVAVAVDAAKRGIDTLGVALRALRDAAGDAGIAERSRQVRMAADALAASLSAVAAQYEATVAAGQRALSVRDQPAAAVPPAHQAQRAPAAGDLALAVDSLLQCRKAYDQVSGAYREQLGQLVRALDGDHSLSGVQAAAPAIAGLLEDQGELRSVLTDVEAKSRAVATEIAIAPLPR